jgi:transposase
MKQKSGPRKPPAEQVLKDIRRQTRRQYSAEEKIRIVLEGLRGEENISELCRREGIAALMYYGWSKEFLEAGKRRLAGDTARAATAGEVSINNLTPADVYFGRAETILAEGQRIKRETIANRRLQHRLQAALNSNP